MWNAVFKGIIWNLAEFDYDGALTWTGTLVVMAMERRDYEAGAGSALGEGRRPPS